MSWLAGILVVVPLLGSLISFVMQGGMRRPIALVISTVTFATAISVAIALWEGGGPLRHPMGGWTAPLGVDLYIDGLSAVMLILASVVGAAISLYAVAYYRAERARAEESRSFWPLWYMLWAAMNGVFVSADIFNLYVVFEIVGIGAVALVTLRGRQGALQAAMRYMIAAFIGSLCYLLGVALLYAQYGVLDLFLLGEVVRATPATTAAFGLMASGLAMKTALFPFHFWLPPAHSAAAAPVSAALSGLVVKTSFFVLIRLWFTVFNGALTLSIAQLIGLLGAIAILWGSFQALRQRRLKLLIAHSTVAQVGYMFLLFPLTALGVGAVEDLSVDWLNEAWTGVTYQVISHALAKGALFLAAGSIVYSYGTDRLGALRGMYRRLPLSTFAIAVAGVSLTGLPPSGGFVAKWLIMKAAIGSGQWWWIPVIVIGGLLTAGYMVLILRYALAATVPLPVRRPVRRSMEIAALTLAVLAILAGFRLEEPLDLLIIGSPFPIEAPGGVEVSP
jgi:multicomponent Na+:H+ antiporter subunit D